MDHCDKTRTLYQIHCHCVVIVCIVCACALLCMYNTCTTFIILLSDGKLGCCGELRVTLASYIIML